MKYILTVLLFCFFLVPPASAQSAWTISSFDSSITVQTDGTVLVTEIIDVDFTSLEKHGIYRDIPVIYQDDNGEKTYTKITVQSIKQDNSNAEYERKDNDNNTRIRIGDPDKTISGTHTYEIRYMVTGVLRSFTDHDELYWNVTGNDWEADIEKVNTTVILPKGEITKTSCFEGYTGGTNGCLFIGQVSDTVVSFANNDLLSPGKGITIAVGFTKGIVPILTVDPPKTIANDLFTFPSLFGLVFAVAIGIVGSIGLWMKNGRDFWFKTRQILDPNAPQEVMPIGAKEITVVEFEPPEKLRPAEIGVLMDEKADTLDITATIIDLANRGYLTITEIPKKWLFGSTDYELTQSVISNEVRDPKLQQNKQGISLPTSRDRNDTLLSYEKILLDRLFPDSQTIKLSELRTTFYDDLAQVKKQLYADIMKKKLFIKNPESTRHVYIGIGFGVLILAGVCIWAGAQLILTPLLTFGFGTIISGVLLMITADKMPRRSAVGRELYQRAKGYQLFIGGAEKYRQQFLEKKNIFTDVLAYAIVFGLTEKFAKAMKEMGVTAQQPTWYSGVHTFNPGIFVSDVNAFSKSLSTAIASTPSKSGGFSGGSSGGGFGGGGGGSW